MHYLENGLPAVARQLLEDIVAERPQFAGAWLDLAIAAQRSGQVEAALEHLAYVRAHFPLTSAMERQLQFWQEEWTRVGGAAPAAWHGNVQFNVGRDSNANSGVSNDLITLTIPGGVAQLLLDPSYRPRSDGFYQLNLNFWREWQTSVGYLFPMLQIKTRQMEYLNDFNQQDLQAGLVYQSIPDGDGRSWQAGTFLQHYRLGGRGLSDSVRFVLQRHHGFGQCRLALGGELEWRKYRDLPLDGLLGWLEMGLGCKPDADLQLSGILRLGHETPLQDERPGGSNHQFSIGAQASYRFSGKQLLEARAEYQQIRDGEGYSPLLENNAARHLGRSLLGLSLRQPLGGGWEALLSLEQIRQRSNLSIFEHDSRQFSVGVSRTF